MNVLHLYLGLQNAIFDNIKNERNKHNFFFNLNTYLQYSYTQLLSLQDLVHFLSFVYYTCVFYRWDESTLWSQGALVRHSKDLYKAEGVATAAEPGNSMHCRFYVS